MSVHQLLVRFEGLYLALARKDDSTLYIKAGRTIRPVERMLEIGAGVPFNLDTFVHRPVENSFKIVEAERELLAALKPWKVRGEWHEVPLSDKAAFNAAFMPVFDRYGSAVRKLVKVHVPSYLKYQQERKKQFAKTRRGRSVIQRALRDRHERKMYGGD